MLCIFSNARLFIKLCFIETQNAHNFLLVDEIKAQSNARAFYEAFFESGPQLLIQFPFVLSVEAKNIENSSKSLILC